MPFPRIKRDTKFAAYIRRIGLFFDKSELASTRIKYIGFFDKKLPHGTRIPFFTSLIHKMVKITKPFQIRSLLIHASPESDVKSYVYMLLADPADEATILTEMQQFTCSHTKFYGWETFQGNAVPLADKENILMEMNKYATPNMSIVFNGFKDNVLMRSLPQPSQSSKTITRFGTGNSFAVLQDDSDDDEEMAEDTRLRLVKASPSDTDLDVVLCDVCMLDFIQERFVDDMNNSLFIQIYGPANNQIEVHYDQWNHEKVQAVEQILLATLNSFMSNEAQAAGLTKPANPAPPQPIQHQPRNTSPISHKQGYNAKRRKPLFSLTDNQGATYHSASLEGIRKIDVPIPSNNTTLSPGITSYASVTNPSTQATTLTTLPTQYSSITPDNSTLTTDNNDITQHLVDTISKTLRSEFDAQLRGIKDTMTIIQSEASEAKTIATSVDIKMIAQQKEVITNIANLKQGIDNKFKQQDEISIATKTLLEQLVAASTLSQHTPQSHQVRKMIGSRSR